MFKAVHSTHTYPSPKHKRSFKAKQTQAKICPNYSYQISNFGLAWLILIPASFLIFIGQSFLMNTKLVSAEKIAQINFGSWKKFDF